MDLFDFLYKNELYLKIEYHWQSRYWYVSVLDLFFQENSIHPFQAADEMAHEAMRLFCVCISNRKAWRKSIGNYIDVPLIIFSDECFSKKDEGCLGRVVIDEKGKLTVHGLI